ncbi:MAG: ABC-2 transporter permease [Clostridiales bacterium]|jgi:ABC-2 type transport system permease protein|nr:ABC-2 transporter permease [Clostridiales bacterium]
MTTLKMIKADWLAIKSHHWRLLIMTAIIAIFALSGMSLVVLPISVYMALAFSVNSFEVEEKGKLDSLFLTLPVTRRDIVRGRYAFLLFFVILAMAVSGGVIVIAMPQLAFGEIVMSMSPATLWLLCSFSFALCGFINLCMYPTLFALGYAKGKMWGFYLPVILIALLFSGLGLVMSNEELVMKVIAWIAYWSDHSLKVGGAFVLIGLGLLYISYSLSVMLYKKRNL